MKTKRVKDERKLNKCWHVILRSHTWCLETQSYETFLGQNTKSFWWQILAQAFQN